MASLTPGLNGVWGRGEGEGEGRKGQIEGWLWEGLIWLGRKEEEAISRLRLDRGASILC